MKTATAVSCHEQLWKKHGKKLDIFGLINQNHMDSRIGWRGVCPNEWFSKPKKHPFMVYLPPTFGDLYGKLYGCYGKHDLTLPSQNLNIRIVIF